MSKATVAGLVLLALGVLSATLPFVLMAVNGMRQTMQVADYEQAVAAVPDAAADRAMRRAVDYNRRLFVEGPRALGEASDPWSGDGGAIERSDKAYRDALDISVDGVMATISYPSLGIDLPIRHGTDAGVLSAGAGHLYGTSLPVGGANTHAVISAHTGYDRLMFDRLSLGEGHVGDYFTVDVLGRTLAYRVEDIRVIDPDDFSYFAIRPGRDEVTLLTCTPYGANTRRLIVTGERAVMPGAAAHRGVQTAVRPEWLMLAAVFAAWGLFGAFAVRTLRRRGVK